MPPRSFEKPVGNTYVYLWRNRNEITLFYLLFTTAPAIPTTEYTIRMKIDSKAAVGSRNNKFCGTLFSEIVQRFRFAGDEDNKIDFFFQAFVDVCS